MTKRAGGMQRLHTPRLRLRPWTPGDAAPLAAAIGNYEVARWLGQVPYPYDETDAARFIDSAEPGSTWAICKAGQIVGGIGLDGNDLGYWFARPAWGRGFATEACDAVVDAFFADAAAQTLGSSHFEGNERSARVLIKQGFRYAGVRQVPSRALSQDITSYAMTLTRPDWVARRQFLVTTPRLHLRELRDGDFAPLHRILGQDSVARMLLNIAVPWTEDQAQHWYLASKYRGRLGFRAAICLRGRLIGVVGIGPSRPGGGQRCLYVIDPDHWGHGFATEALTAFLADTMTRFRVQSVEADHFDDNLASGAVLRRAGFVAVGKGPGTSLARQGEHPMTLYRLDRAALVQSRAPPQTPLSTS